MLEKQASDWINATVPKDAVSEERIRYLNSGNGYGYGKGSSNGYGYGNGNGYGDGYGSGYSNGYGNDYGVVKFNNLPVYTIDTLPTIITHIRGNAARAEILNPDFTLTRCYVVKNQYYFAHGATLKEAYSSLNVKILADKPVDERIADFVKHFEKGKKYPALEFSEWHLILTGSCELGRTQFANVRGIDLSTDMFTVKEFVDLTKESYRGDIITRILN